MGAIGTWYMDADGDGPDKELLRKPYVANSCAVHRTALPVYRGRREPSNRGIALANW